VIEPGDRIAQLVVQEFVSVRLVEVEELGDSVRGQGGFGSTGVRSVVVEEEVVEEEVPATV
jgi:dUTP pyrophosphatase